jgi:hypothetical protein
MANGPEPFKINLLNCFCGFSLIMVYGVLFGDVGCLGAAILSFVFFPPFEDKRIG